jgi:hypothetical protein
MSPSGREYVRLWSDLASHPKWGRLSLVLRGAWASLLAYAGSRNDPTFTVERAVWLLARDGDDEAEAHVVALVEARWLDREGDTVSLHDWDDHQPLYRGPSDSPEAKAARNALRPRTRVERAGARGSDVERVRATEERRREERTTTPNPPEGSVVVVAYEDLYGGRRPGEPGVAWLLAMESDSGSERVLRALRTEHKRDSDPRTLLGRMQAGLRVGDAQRRAEARYGPAEEAN